MLALFTRCRLCLTHTGGFDKSEAFPVSIFGFDNLWRNRRGNVAMMYALVAPVLVFAGGAAIDYVRTAQIRTKLNCGS